MIVLGILLAVLAAGANATASVLQRKAARREPSQRAGTLRLVWDLAHQPVWFGGILSVMLGFLLQAVALSQGRISVVQPLLVLELPFTLLLASVMFRARLRLLEWSAAAMMTGGLIVFLFSLNPTGGAVERTGLAAWILGIAVTLAVVAVFIALGYRHRGDVRAANLAVATGIVFGLTAVMLNAVTEAFSGGIMGVLTAWQTYMVVVMGPSSFFLLQNTLQAGRLVAAQPGLTLADPLVAIVWGVIVFSEDVRTGPWLIGALVGAGVIVLGTFLLSRSPLLHDSETSGRQVHRGTSGRRSKRVS